METDFAYIIPHNQEALNILEYRGFKEVKPSIVENSGVDLRIIAVPKLRIFFAYMYNHSVITEKLIYSILELKTKYKELTQFREILDYGTDN